MTREGAFSKDSTCGLYSAATVEDKIKPQNDEELGYKFVISFPCQFEQGNGTELMNQH